MRRIFPLSLLAFLAGVRLMATDLSWSLSLGGDHRTSDGQSLPAGTRFQIGTFSEDFVPTPENAASWKDHWRAAGEVLYDTVWQGFGGVVRVEESTPSFGEGTRFYIWGFRQTGPAAAEWILATHSSWTVPSPDPFAFPVFVDLADGDVIVGGADPVAKTITTAAVDVGSVPTFGWEEWRGQYFFLVEREDPAISGPDADPDGDGLTNAMEHALGTNPKVPNGGGTSVGMTVVKSGTSQVEISFPGTSTVPGGWSVETSVDLEIWTPVTPPLEFDPGLQRWRFSETLETRRFWRLAPAN